MRLILSILLCQLVGIVGSFFTFPSITTWYQTLTKPSFTPPSFVFGPAWFILYTLMGISLYYLYGKRVTSKNKTALIFFAIQLLFNLFWSIVFFGFHSPLGGLAVIIPLWIFILLTMLTAYKVSKVSSLILIPYLLWVSFASLLNYSVYTLNP